MCLQSVVPWGVTPRFSADGTKEGRQVGTFQIAKIKNVCKKPSVAGRFSVTNMTEKWRFGTNDSLLAEKCAPNSCLKWGETSEKTRFSMARSRESSRWTRDWAIFLGFCVRKVGTVLSLTWGKGQMASGWGEGWTGCGEKVHRFSERRGVFAKSGGFSSRTCAVFLRPCCRLGQSGRRYKKTPRIPKSGGVCASSRLALFVRGYALASGAPKGVAVRPTPSVAAG